MNTHPDSQENTPALSPKIEQELQAPPPREKALAEVNPEQLQDEAAQRAKQRPVIQRIVKTLRRDKAPFVEIIINSESLEKRVALLDDGVLEKFDIERIGEERLVGSIFKGKIQNLEPGLKAAFVDIGMPKNAFLHYWDILPAAADSSIEIVRDTRTTEQKNRRNKFSLKDIPNLYPVGADIILQVTKGQIGTKGPRTTTNIALAGRYLVLMPYAGQCGISRKIENVKERQRLKKTLRSLTIPDGMGVIIRTAGEGMKIRFFIRDLHILLRQWDDIQARLEEPTGPICLYREPDIIERTVRDFLTEDIDRVLIDNPSDCKFMEELVSEISPRSRSKITLFKEDIPIFERFNIEPQFEQTFQRSVPLPSGGQIMIDETEALVAIDVNTGAHKSKDKDRDGKNFILQCNLEAAIESARQIRLRNIGGLIILDFVDMKQRRDRNTILRTMRKEMAKDNAKCNVLPISQFGIMQMTRQRSHESVASGLYNECPYCYGRGIVKSPRTMSVEIQRRLVSVIRRLRSLKQNDDAITLRILCHPHSLERLRLEDENLLVEIEELYNVKLAFRADPSYHVENFKILDAETGQELR